MIGKQFFIIIALFFVAVFAISTVFAVAPSGATVTNVSSTAAPADVAQSTVARAGNVSELGIDGFSNTQTWQGYYGNVTGTIQLADVSDNVMYNWSLASPQGEVYTSENSSIIWTNVQCFNYTAEGTLADDSANKGQTSMFGLNLTQTETRFNITWNDVDGLNETFRLTGAGTHDIFYTNNLQFSEGECINTRIYSNIGTGESNKFEEVLLYSPDTKGIVFASILDEDLLGFDNKYHDFEMVVLEDGHSTDTTITPYYFYVELQ